MHLNIYHSLDSLIKRKQCKRSAHLDFNLILECKQFRNRNIIPAPYLVSLLGVASFKLFAFELWRNNNRHLLKIVMRYITQIKTVF